MASLVFEKRSHVPASAEALFDWHARPGAFQRLTPPWEGARVESEAPALRAGERVRLSVPILGPLRGSWVAEYRDVRPGRAFTDVQVKGPFARWEHTHAMVPDGPGACWLEDRVVYAPPLGALGRLLAGPLVRRRLRRLFAHRHAVTVADAEDIARRQDAPALRVLVTGSHGLIGSELVPLLQTSGHEVVRAVRRSGDDGVVVWSPEEGFADPSALEGVDAVIHLAGENVAAGRWTEGRKRRIRESRLEGTRRVAEAVAALARPPAVLACASATGFYGDRGDETLTEESAAGSGFLADVCRDWEAAAAPARDAGIRVVHARFGVVLAPGGGALGKMLTPFRLGAGGRIGSGRQWVSWIGVDDAARALVHALLTPGLRGPLNVVAPGAVRQAALARTLGRVLRRPALLPLPAPAARLVFGEMADEVLLAGARVTPGRLRDAGFAFRHEELEPALRHLLGRALRGAGAGG